MGINTGQKKLTICKEQPTYYEQNNNGSLTKRYFRFRSAIKDIGPIFRGEYLVNGQKRIVDLSKIDELTPLHITTQ